MATMKVRALMERLAGCDPDADAYIAVDRELLPLEMELAGVAVREDFEDVEDEESERIRPPFTPRGPEQAMTDVLFTAGEDVRMGNRDAWAAAR